MDTGVNRNGVRWVVDDEREHGKGYVARLRRDGQPLVFAGREGFSTHEDAVEWASRFESGDDDEARPFVPILVAGLGVVVLLSLSSRSPACSREPKASA